MLDATTSASLPVSAAPQSKIGAVLRATGGNFLEMYDFFLFGIYAAPIGKAFFHTGSEFLDTSAAFIVFWVGALMRPLGAIYLGAYVDSLGRRKGLIVTLAIMAIGTVIIAVTPAYATIGIVGADHRRARPAVAGLFRRRGARRRLGLSGGDRDARHEGLRHLVPVGEPAGRRVRRRADRLCRSARPSPPRRSRPGAGAFRS